MNFLVKYALVVAAVAVGGTVLHELSHAGLDRANGYRGPFRIYTGPEAWQKGWVAGYQRTGDAPPGIPAVATHHRIIEPTQDALSLLVPLVWVGFQIRKARRS